MRIDPDGRSFIGAYGTVNHTGAADNYVYDEAGYADRAHSIMGNPSMIINIGDRYYFQFSGGNSGGGSQSRETNMPDTEWLEYKANEVINKEIELIRKGQLPQNQTDLNFSDFDNSKINFKLFNSGVASEIELQVNGKTIKATFYYKPLYGDKNVVTRVNYGGKAARSSAYTHSNAPKNSYVVYFSAYPFGNQTRVEIGYLYLSKQDYDLLQLYLPDISTSNP